ncbi:MAG TPA: quinone-dependent dihydroorotate dehydrogenase [Alphaproteobacteria bacterium]
MSALFPLLKPVLHAMDAEKAHQLTLKALRILPASRAGRVNPVLAQDVIGLHFPSPVGMAAGFDKNAEVLDGLLGCGFGFVEAGTVTPKAQAGNPKPRVFRDPGTRSVINRMGFPGGGADVFVKNYHAFREKGRNKGGIIGINIGKNKDTTEALDDYKTLIRIFAPIADYLTVNISSPNTPGLRDLQKREHLLPLLEEIKKERARVSAKTTPILVKLAPDLHAEDRAQIAQTVLDAGIDGLVLTNTTLERPAALPEKFRLEMGGLSGPLVRDKATETIRDFYALTKGNLPIIGVGGISSAADAYMKIRAGASLIQLYTALVYQGPAMLKHLQKDLALLLKIDGFTHISQAVGADHR